MLILNSFSLSKLFISLYKNRILIYYSRGFFTSYNKYTLNSSSLKLTCTYINFTKQDSIFILNLNKYINYI